MARTYKTPLMQLVLPVVGPQGQLGPDYANNIDTAFERVDSHNHVNGNGSPITQDGINISADFSLNGYNLLSAKSLRFADQGAALSDLTCIYSANGHLYFNTPAGVQIQITNDSGINLTSLGTIGGDYSTSSAAVTYTASTKLFLFKQDGTKTADIACGSLFVYENVASAKYTKIQSTSGQVSNQTVTLWAALPASTLPSLLSATGVLSTGLIQTAMIADVAVGTAELADSAVSTAKMADGAVTQAKRASLGQQLSSSSGAFQTTVTASFTDAMNLNVTITTTGRPVWIGLQADGDNGAFNYAYVASTSGIVALVRGSTQIWQTHIQGGSGSTFVYLPPGSIWCIDTPAAGNYTYKVQVKAQDATNGIGIFRCKLVAFEL